MRALIDEDAAVRLQTTLEFESMGLDVDVEGFRRTSQIECAV